LSWAVQRTTLTSCYRTTFEIRRHGGPKLFVFWRLCLAGQLVARPYNSLTDLTSLILFLRTCPFEDPSAFKQHFLLPWKQKTGHCALMKSRSLVRMITIRRTKEVINHPPRVNHLRRIEFSSAEKVQYEMIRSQIYAAADAGDSSKSKPYINILR
jgi:hypothetical protein